MVAVGPPPGLSAPPSASTLLLAFRRRWRLALLVALLGAGLAAVAAWAAFPGQYVSAIVFRVSSRPPRGFPEEESPLAQFQQAQVALLKSDALLSKALRQPAVTELGGGSYTVEKLQKLLVADFKQGPEILSVSLAGEQAEVVAA